MDVDPSLVETLKPKYKSKLLNDVETMIDQALEQYHKQLTETMENDVDEMVERKLSGFYEGVQSYINQRLHHLDAFIKPYLQSLANAGIIVQPNDHLFPPTFVNWKALQAL